MKSEPIPFVDLSFQTTAIRTRLMSEVDDILTGSSFVAGEAVVKFESEWASYLGSSSSVAVGNGGDALEVGLRTLKIGNGDEVIIPSNTFAATAQAVLMVGAIPVAVDVAIGSNLMDVEAAKSAVTTRTRAIIAVNLFGERYDGRELAEWCSRRGIVYCEDAAQSHGAILEGRRLADYAAFTAFSFYPAKNLGAFGDAGAIVFSHKSRDNEARKIRNYGGQQKYEHSQPGRNSRMDSIQAAVLSCKLPHLDMWNSMRREVAHQYIDNLSDLECEDFVLPTKDEEMSHAWHLFVLETNRRDRLAAGLTAAEIGWGIHYPKPVNSIPGVTGQPPRLANQRSGRILSLPIFPGMTSSQVERVCAVVRSSL